MTDENAYKSVLSRLSDKNLTFEQLYNYLVKTDLISSQQVDTIIDKIAFDKTECSHMLVAFGTPDRVKCTICGVVYSCSDCYGSSYYNPQFTLLFDDRRTVYKTCNSCGLNIQYLTCKTCRVNSCYCGCPCGCTC